MAGHIAGTRGRTAAVRCGVASAAVALLWLSGCASGPDFEWPDDPVPEPAATLPPAEAEAIDAVLAVFEEFRRAEVAVAADPEPAHAAQHQLNAYLADPLLAVTLLEVDTLHRRGLVREGEPTWAPEVVEVRLDATPPTATIRDCLDATGWPLATRTGGEAALDGLPTRFELDRYVMEFNARFVDGRWLLDEARVERGEQC